MAQIMMTMIRLALVFFFITILQTKKKSSPFGELYNTNWPKTSVLGNKNTRQTTPRVLRFSSLVRIPTPDAMLYISSQLAPMKYTASMSVYGGLVPLGFTHSN
jgi:hypothetical protein